MRKQIIINKTTFFYLACCQRNISHFNLTSCKITTTKTEVYNKNKMTKTLTTTKMKKKYNK